MAYSGPRYLICVDYGTTFTGVGWILTSTNTPSLQDVMVTTLWSGGRSNPKVPSEMTYCADPGHHDSWGYGAEGCPHSLKWKKLELEPPSREKALSLLQKSLEDIQLLGSMNDAVVDLIPLHLIKTAEGIVTDFLTEVAICVRNDISSKKDAGTLRDFPIDLIITHPASWHPRARNSTFRATHEAFRRIFSEMNENPGKVMLTTEPEACAHYAMRVAQDQGMAARFRVGECFVVVDAGGGTVVCYISSESKLKLLYPADRAEDLASYRIDGLSPNFSMTKVTQPSGGYFGATWVDEYFISKFLPSRLGAEDYKTLVETTVGSESHGETTWTENMRGKFKIIRETFAGPPSPSEQRPDNLIDLGSSSIADDADRGIKDGHLRLTFKDLQDIFRESVEGTLHLIMEQLVQVEVMDRKVRTLFLSGGFSMNPYLYKRISGLAQQRNVNLVRGDERELGGTLEDNSCWTAVVKGAALIGLGIGCDVPPRCVACPYHIGVVVSAEFRQYYPGAETHHLTYIDEFDGKTRIKDQTKWLVAKGDLITEHDRLEKTIKISRKMGRTGNGAGSVTVVCVADRDNTNATYDQRILLDYDLKTIPHYDQPAIIQQNNRSGGDDYYNIVMELVIRLDQTNVHAGLVCGRAVDIVGNTGYVLARKSVPLPAQDPGAVP